MAYKDHTMGKGKARVTTRNQKAHEILEEDGWGHGPFKMKGYTYPGTSPIEKKVSWEWDGKTHYGDYIREDSKYVYARTVNGKIKKKPKK